ncbi:hypothetical protein JTE90_002616 [Oedothorax gibbosus]|uniref:ABC-type glutathione-S-conjugate transporter n=2 Tax=Oedothorax gibbosus TaxID=931172 RepID=A0AAV6UCL8_9ARAC|nr:hypothetical protein JTE90_002616 [Oedothorax gibbosus]
MSIFGNYCEEAFFDLNQTWYSQVPEFSPCFEDTVFITFPSIVYCIALLCNLCLLPRSSPQSALPWTWLNISKLFFTVSLVLVSCAKFGIIIRNILSIEDKVPVSLFLSSCTRIAVFIFVISAILKHKSCGKTTSATISTFWITFSICSIFIYRSDILKYFVLHSKPASGINFILDMVYHPLVFMQLILSVFVDRKKFSLLQENTKVLDEVSFLALYSFVWFIKYIHIGRKRLLVVSDLAFLTVQLKASWVYSAFSRHWKYYLLPIQPKYPSLGCTLVRALWPYVIATFVLQFFYVAAIIVPPFLLDRIINFVTDDQYIWKGYFFVALTFFLSILSNNIFNCLIYLESVSAIQFQSALMGCLFRKNMCLSTAARRDYPSGSIMNLLTVDVKRIQWFTIQSVDLFTAPIKIVIIISILWKYLGISTLAGIGVMLLLIPVTYYISRAAENYTDKQMEMKDVRLKHMNEVLNGIKILKLYAWEIPFQRKVTEARRKEIKWIQRSLFCYVVTTFIYFCTPFLISLVTFGTYLLIDRSHVLSPTQAFVSLTLMEQLKSALYQLPDSISELIQCNISLGRIRKFLHAENKIPEVVGNKPGKGDCLTICDASFSWSPDGECFLKDINLSVSKGKLIAVIGPVGAGKSSLLSAVLGEMYRRKGLIDIEGDIAYVPQHPWVLNRTLKENILLIKPDNRRKYNKVLDLCCLRPDLDILPAGDKTEIGEKGVNLSGGQKLRVNLAQAVYQDNNIYLLDDPLSAVDVHVKKSLFKNVIGNEGILKDKTRILVTHDVSILKDVDLIVSMKEGKIDEVGTYNELISHNGSFTKFMKEHSKMKDEDEVEKSIHLPAISANTNDEDEDELLIGGGDLIGNEGDCQLLINEQYTDEANDETHRLTEDEGMEIGGVHRFVYFKYVKQMGVALFILGAFWYMIYIALEGGANVWLSEWSSDAARNTTTSKSLWRLSVYGGFGLAQVFSVVVGGFILVYAATKASKLYHNNMLDSVLKSPMSFFDKTPTGRIINRFTTDMDTLDILLFYRMEGWLTCLFSTLSSFVIIGINTPVFLTFLLPIGIFYFLIQKYHLTTFRQIKRLESTSRSPIYSLFMESIQGVSSITAYGIQDEFIESFEEKLDNCFVCTHNSYNCNRWLTFNLDFLGSVIVLVATLLAIFNRHTLSPSIVGLIFSYAIRITDDLKWFVRMNSELEDKSISVERIDEYCHLEPEAPWELSHKDLKDNWPEHGNIEFENYSTRYRENLDLVLKNIDIGIYSSEKVGVLGRTGAGKSSVTLALFRIIEPVSGTISIDNIDITKIGLHTLRSKLTIIPQDPLLFTGSLRMNLDPNNEHNDDELWNSLEKSYLKSFVSSLSEGLDYKLEEGGANLSAGQRQLICLARALLKNSRILVLDEATASIDMDTDNLIQNTIRTAFADRTVITIAHRIHTVLDYDKIIIMDSGHVVEVGDPKALLQDPNSRFYEMNKEAGLT